MQTWQGLPFLRLPKTKDIMPSSSVGNCHASGPCHETYSSKAHVVNYRLVTRSKFGSSLAQVGLQDSVRMLNVHLVPCAAMDRPMLDVGHRDPCHAEGAWQGTWEASS